MKNVRQQKMIASILLDIGLDDDIIEVITSLTKEEIEQIKIEYRTIDNYWSKENMKKHFFKEIKQYFYEGDYYKLSIAVKKIEDE